MKKNTKKVAVIAAVGAGVAADGLIPVSRFTYKRLKSS